MVLLSGEGPRLQGPPPGSSVARSRQDFTAIFPKEITRFYEKKVFVLISKKNLRLHTGI